MFLKKSVWLTDAISDYLGFASGLQLVFVVAQPFVIEPYIFCQGADLLEPNFLRKRALDAVTLMHNLPLENRRRRATCCYTACRFTTLVEVLRGSYWK